MLPNLLSKNPWDPKHCKHNRFSVCFPAIKRIGDVMCFIKGAVPSRGSYNLWNSWRRRKVWRMETKANRRSSYMVSIGQWKPQMRGRSLRKVIPGLGNTQCSVPGNRQFSPYSATPWSSACYLTEHASSNQELLNSNPSHWLTADTEQNSSLSLSIPLVIKNKTTTITTKMHYSKFMSHTCLG